MEIISNADGFVREIRSIEVYNASDVSFIDIHKGTVPQLQKIVVFKNIIPEDFNRTIKLKYNNDNLYFDIDILFALYTADTRLNSTTRVVFGKRKFAVKLITNADELWLGNDREPLTIDLQDSFKDDNSGTDKYEVSIYGSTIIDPNYVL